MQNKTKYWRYHGAFFQIPFIFLWGMRGMYWRFYPPYSTNAWGFGDSLNATGVAIMVISMFRIYTFNRTKQQLLTTDIFAVTRHPMYHGMFLADLGNFFSISNPWTPFFMVTWVATTACMCAAAWCQEQETLARWGTQATEYYARTPQFAISWIWRWM
jgi:protein-S-isoprenylcysteine O-methyltransferase Ste14